MNWLTTTATVPAVTLISLAGWASFATCLLLGQWLMHRQCGIAESAGPPTVWDEQDQPRATAADRVRETA